VSPVGASPLLGRSSNLNVEATSPGYPGLTLPTQYIRPRQHLVLHAKCLISVAIVGPGVLLFGAGVWTLLKSLVPVELEDIEVGDSGLWRSAIGGTCLVCGTQIKTHRIFALQYYLYHSISTII
jgi:hypothetical protein